MSALEMKEASILSRATVILESIDFLYRKELKMILLNRKTFRTWIWALDHMINLFKMHQINSLMSFIR